MPILSEPPARPPRARVPRTRPPMEAPMLPPVRPVPAALVPLIRSTVPTMQDRITVRIRTDVPPLALAGERLHQPISEAVAIALDGFVELAGESGAYGDLVVEHFRGIGRSLALAGATTHPVLSALQTAAQVVWEDVDEVTRRETLPGPHVSDLGRSLADYLHHLGYEVERGFAQTRRAAAGSHRELLKALTGEDTESSIAELASRTGWAAPKEVVVIAAATQSDRFRLDVPIPESVFIGLDHKIAIVLTKPNRVDVVRAALLGAGPSVMVANSWPMPISRASDAYRWARRALTLASQGRIRVHGRVVDCAEHRMALWREADTALLDRLGEELLEPLEGKKPHNRVAIAETLERWLIFNESVPVLAEALGVHPNTVRHRLRELRRLYGDRLDDADDRLLLRACLGSRLPDWRSKRAPRRYRKQGSTQAKPSEEELATD